MIRHTFSRKIDATGEKNHYTYFYKLGQQIRKPKDKITVA